MIGWTVGWVVGGWVVGWMVGWMVGSAGRWVRASVISGGFVMLAPMSYHRHTEKLSEVHVLLVAILKEVRLNRWVHTHRI